MTTATTVPIPPNGHQRIVPYLTYRDAPAAIDFLCRAFGFEPGMRLDMPNGKIGHAELSYRGNVVMLASEWPNSTLVSPLDAPNVHCQVSCYVEDVDAHHAHAKAAGAHIAAAPQDQVYGARTYRATDSEGHRWLFSQPTKEMTLAEIKAAMGG